MQQRKRNRMMFAQRHYEWIAGDISEQLAIQDTTEAVDVLWSLAEHMADGFSQDNPNFNRERFLNACRVLPT